MNDDTITSCGQAGLYTLSDGNVISFQMGDTLTPSPLSPQYVCPPLRHVWLNVKGYNVLARGANNALCDEVTMEIKQNRLLPRLYSKEIKMLYGHGPALHRQAFQQNKLRRIYTEVSEVTQWLQSWPSMGLPSVEEFCKTCIKNYYYFGDYFVKWRFTRGHRFGLSAPVAALEALENNQCRLATLRNDVAYNLVAYNDFAFVAVGQWNNGFGFSSNSYSIYPRFDLRDVQRYRFAAVSHHREKSVGEFYGANETHQGARPYIQGSNRTAHYINSFLRNSLAAKIHIIIPNAWVESKRNQISRLCEENKARQAKNVELLKYNGIDIGTEMRESTLLQYVKLELRKISAYLTGEANQGKAYSTFSFIDSQGHEQAWRIETVDLKYKEYIDALIAYDKRTEQALLSSVGLDAAISAVDKDGVISKSGSDSYYNYLIYIMSLTPEDEICSEPLNLALRLNFPQLYAEGYRFGYYREVPQRQEDISPSDRLNRQQS